MKNSKFSKFSNLVGKIITFGNPTSSVTCSQSVAKICFPKLEPIGCNSFEEGVKILKSGQSNYLLVPGAYPEVSALIQDDSLPMFDIFMHDIPSLVYGKMVDDINQQPEIVFYHPATKSLLNKLPFINRLILNLRPFQAMK